MDRRHFLKSALALPGLSLANQKKRNVLFIAVDDLRPSVGCYGDPYAKTPNIDALAERGLVFDRAYCQRALCAPSRASQMTGLRPDTIGVHDMATSFRKALPDAVSLPQHFRQYGYHVEGIGKIYHGNEVNQDESSWSVPATYNVGPVKNDQYALNSHKDPENEWRKVAATEMADVPDDV